jgi:quinol-cytochrome oxidoreductase complex cytochrome b subunit
LTPAGRDSRQERPDAGLPARIWRSIFRTTLHPETERERKRVVLDHLVFHARPVRLPERTMKFTHTWGLGGMSLVLFTLLLLTGVLLMFVYEPVPAGAHGSVLRLQTEVRFGQFVRNIHHWSANLLIFVAVLHLLRVYFTGAFHGARQFNWVIGLFLLVAILGAGFTGYLLPWDQLSYWAITISTAMIAYVPGIGVWLQQSVRGGEEIGGATLLNFYTLHTTLIPALLIIVMAFHFWRVRKAGGVVLPHGVEEEPEEKPVSALSFPHLLLRELVVALILVAFVLAYSVALDARLGEAANPGMSPNPTKAPWYFMGVQELLLHFHPIFAVVIGPTLVALGLHLIPYLRYDTEQAGAWFLSSTGRRTAALAAAIALVVTPVWVVLDEFVLDPGALLPGLPAAISNGLLPFSVLLAALWGLYAVLRRRNGATRGEAVQALFVLLFVAFSILTATGVWFRGAGMALIWPWGV